MTKQELAYAQFANLFDFEYYAQPDGGAKSVIFAYLPKSMYVKDQEEWIEPRRFEASSLEKAFNYAFSLEGLIEVPVSDRRAKFGLIRRFNRKAWEELEYKKEFFSLQGNCWKKLSDVLALEKAENERKLAYYATL